MDKLSNDISKLDISVTYQKDLVVINSQETEDKTSTINITNTTPETDESHDSGKTYESYNSARPPRRKARDPTWLQVEVCREYLRQECHRSAEECKFAHPKNHCAIENGRVITCYDSLKSRCSRERCKYYHPPKHIKKQIQQLGKSYQKMGYNQPNIENTETQNYDPYQQYPCWVPWNVYYLTDVYPYPHAYPNYGYYNYFDVFPNCENYKLEYDQNYYSYEDPSNNNQNIKIENSTTSPSKEKCAIITDNTN